MKIALVAPPWNPVPPKKYGGSESQVDGLARALHRQGHDVELIAAEGSTSPVPMRQIPPGSQPWPFSPVCTEVGFVIKAFDGIESYDVVHDNTIVGALYARAFPNTPVVTTNHGPFIGDLETLYNHVVPWCTVVSVSHNQASKTPFSTPVVHHGVDTDYFTFGNGQGDANGEYLLFLGLMHERKGVHMAAQAARASGKRLLIAAKMNEQAEMDYFEAQVRPLLGENVEFIGEVGGEEKVRLLQNAKALINPVNWPEPFGLVMTEALACGTPVIALPNGAAPEIVADGKTGIVCRTELDLADACGNIDDISREACRDSATEYFCLDRMASDYAAVYEEAIARKSNVVDLESASQRRITVH